MCMYLDEYKATNSPLVGYRKDGGKLQLSIILFKEVFPFLSFQVPSIPLSAQSVTSLLATLAWSPNVPVRTWVFAFQVLTLLTNLRCPSHSATATPTSSTAPTTSTSTASSDKWLATVMVADSNMMMVLIKFLSGSSLHGPVISSHQYTQVRQKDRNPSVSLVYSL